MSKLFVENSDIARECLNLDVFVNMYWVVWMLMKDYAVPESSSLVENVVVHA